jgi:hypothetical protein
MTSKARHRVWEMSACALVLVACVGSELEVPANHPGNPAANSGTIASSQALGKAFDLHVENTEPRVSSHTGHDHHTEETQASSPSPEASAPATPNQTKPDVATYVCPMHPEIVRKEPGKCPICGMKLVPKKEGK